jgi:hypothetical protein
MEQDLGEGVLYFGDTAAGGIHASDYVKELHSEADLQQFLGSQPEEVLTVVGVCVSDASPCIRIFPAVVALARSFKGYATFGRCVVGWAWEAGGLGCWLGAWAGNVAQGLGGWRHIGVSAGATRRGCTSAAACSDHLPGLLPLGTRDSRQVETSALRDAPTALCWDVVHDTARPRGVLVWGAGCKDAAEGRAPPLTPLFTSSTPTCWPPLQAQRRRE